MHENAVAISQQQTSSAGSLIPPVTPTPTPTRTMQSDEDFNIRFVNLVRTHKCLYNKKVPEYRNRDNQEKAWSLISQETRESVIHCKERWRNLRACLSRYIKQQSSPDPQHKPYYLTEHMAFLLPFLKSTRNSLEGNNTLATLFHFSQQQQQSSNVGGIHVINQPHLQFANEQQQLQMKHSLSDNDDEETIDAFDPAVAASLHLQQQHQHSHSHSHPNANNTRCSPALSDTASANTLQNFIPDVQIAELRTPTDMGQDITYVTTLNNHHHHHHHSHSSRLGGVGVGGGGGSSVGGGGGGSGVGGMGSMNDGNDFSHDATKRIKTECHMNDSHQQHLQQVYCPDNSDMEFFRSILPDIAALTPQQKRKFKIGILELIDDVVERYPLERPSVTASSSSCSGGKLRRSSAREWRK